MFEAILKKSNSFIDNFVLLINKYPLIVCIGLHELLSSSLALKSRKSWFSILDEMNESKSHNLEVPFS